MKCYVTHTERPSIASSSALVTPLRVNETPRIMKVSHCPSLTHFGSIIPKKAIALANVLGLTKATLVQNVFDVLTFSHCVDIQTFGSDADLQIPSELIVNESRALGHCALLSCLVRPPMSG